MIIIINGAQASFTMFGDARQLASARIRFTWTSRAFTCIYECRMRRGESLKKFKRVRRVDKVEERGARRNATKGLRAGHFSPCSRRIT